MASLGGHSGAAANKITKARGKMVKPILKKLSHSEKNSLDLDRGWDEQQVEQLEVGEWDGGYGYAGQARDVSFGIAGGGFGPSDGSSSMVAGGGRFKFQHGRSGSQTSAGSGTRGAFVHPFAQTPRTSTPPLSYANSLASFDNARDCSPTITENEDDFGFDEGSALPHAHAYSHTPGGHSQPAAAGGSQSNLRRPSLNSQRTSSFQETPASKPASLRINTGRSASGITAGSSRFAHGSLPTGSNSDLHIASHSLSVSFSGTLDSPTGSLGCGSPPASNSQQQQQPQQSQMSPLRTSLELAAAGFPRLRSRSEVDTAVRAEHIRAARRKFEQREKIKEEKYDREMIRKRERRDTKEASRIEKGEPPNRPAAHRRKTQTGLSTASVPPAAEPGDVKPAGRAFSTPHMSSSTPGGIGNGGTVLGIGKRRHTDSPTRMGGGEKQMGFASRRYESVSLETPPAFGVTLDDVRFAQAPARRGSGAKRKTQGYWQGFLLWLRTKLLRMSGH